MYHRNKVHTDEFWRYELTKNRRSVIDESANDDLWKKQLGRHADDAPAALLSSSVAVAGQTAKQDKTAGKSLPLSEDGKASGGGGSQADNHANWLKQIRSTAAAAVAASGESSSPAALAASPANLSPNMKLLALQSLQKSLQFMTMAGGGKLAASISAEVGADGGKSSPSPTDLRSETGNQTSTATDDDKNESYLSLLAQLACRGGAGGDGRRAAEDHGGGGGGSLLPGPPTNQQSASDRTQLWLQQVKQFSAIKEEQEEEQQQQQQQLAANHEQLWEQQIARVKANPVRSPLEPVEIVIEEGAGENVPAPPPNKRHPGKSHLPPSLAVRPPPASHRPTPPPMAQTPPPPPAPRAQPTRQIGLIQQVQNNNNNNNHHMNYYDPNNNSNYDNLNNNNGNNNNNYNNNTDNERVTIYQAQYVPIQQENCREIDNNRNSSNNNNNNNNNNSQDIHPAGEDRSMLKCLLLDRFKRKRSASHQNDDAAKKAAQTAATAGLPSAATNGGDRLHSRPPPSTTPIPIPQPPKDILRKRLLGWVDPPPSASPPPSRTPSTRSATASPFTPQSRSATGSPAVIYAPGGRQIKSERVSLDNVVVVPEFSLEAADIVVPTVEPHHVADAGASGYDDISAEETLQNPPLQRTGSDDVYGSPNRLYGSTAASAAAQTTPVTNNLYSTSNQIMYDIPPNQVLYAPNQTIYNSTVLPFAVPEQRYGTSSPDRQGGRALPPPPPPQAFPLDLNNRGFSAENALNSVRQPTVPAAAAEHTLEDQQRLPQQDLSPPNSAEQQSQPTTAQARQESQQKPLEQPRLTDDKKPQSAASPLRQVNYAETSVLKHLLYRYNHNKE